MQLSVDRKKIVTKVCNLVADTFLGPRSEGHYVVHKNGDKLDDRLCNLRYELHPHRIKITPETALEVFYAEGTHAAVAPSVRDF